MKIYHYNPITNIFLGEGMADESPLEQGVFLIPAMATNQEPPIYDENQFIKFINNSWTIFTFLYCYYNNGFSYKNVDNTYVLNAGEVVFNIIPTTDQLNNAFPLYNSGVPIKTIDDLIADVEAKYQPKLDAYLQLILNAMGDNGSNQNTKIVGFQTQYKALVAQKNAEEEDIYANN